MKKLQHKNYIDFFLKVTDRYNIMDMLSFMRNSTLNYSVIFIVKIGLRYCIYIVCDCDHT